jgi:phosphoadenosine phosphosulfate reductase
MSRSRPQRRAPVDLPALAAAAAERLNGAPAEEVVAWAVETFFPDVAVACSMQDGVVVDLAVRVERRVEVCFLDTGFHFPETLATRRRLQERYRLNLVELKPADHAAVYALDGNEACCVARKVLPLERYLTGKRAWITGLRRAESPSRARAQAVEWDAGRGLVKVNPLVSWTDDDVIRYVEEHDIVVNPLRRQGYDSIGCAPCTLPGNGREGRWAGTGKLECGLHPHEPPLTRPPDRHHPVALAVGNGSREI